MSSAVALALVATLGVHEASAQKGKEDRKQHPVKVRLECFNLTTGQQDRNITAVVGDSVKIRLRIDNRSGEAQQALVTVHGEVPEWGITYDTTVIEYFEAGQQKEASVSGIVPGAPVDPRLLVNVSVLMTQTGDASEWDASVTFGPAYKAGAEGKGAVSPFHRAFMRMMFKSLLTLTDSGSDEPATVNMTEFKELYR